MKIKINNCSLAVAINVILSHTLRGSTQSIKKCYKITGLKVSVIYFANIWLINITFING